MEIAGGGACVHESVTKFNWPESPRRSQTIFLRKADVRKQSGL